MAGEGGRGIGGVLLDVDGVLVVSWEPLAGAAETLRWLDRRNIPFALVTNTTTLSRRSLAARLSRAGLDVEPDRMVTAGVATAAYLRRNHPRGKCYLLATGDVAEDLAGIDLVDDGADVVVVAGAEDALTYEAMNRAFRMLRDGASLVAMHRNIWWMTSEGPKLDAGPYVTALEEAAGVRAAVVGKPSAEVFLTAVGLLGVPAEQAMMVGDDLDADVLPAQAIGLTGVLVRTGRFREGTRRRAPAPTTSSTRSGTCPGCSTGCARGASPRPPRPRPWGGPCRPGRPALPLRATRNRRSPR